jgi:hypothetical protein
MATSLLLGNASMEKRDHALIINTYINAYHDKTHGPLTRATLTAPLAWNSVIMRVWRYHGTLVPLRWIYYSSIKRTLLISMKSLSLNAWLLTEQWNSGLGNAICCVSIRRMTLTSHTCLAISWKHCLNAEYVIYNTRCTGTLLISMKSLSLNASYQPMLLFTLPLDMALTYNATLVALLVNTIFLMVRVYMRI